MQHPRLRDNKSRKLFELYPLGQIPYTAIIEIAKWIVYYFAVGKSDINGEDWGDIFAKSIEGEHLNSPLGLADVVCEGMAWSVKSVKSNNPHNSKSVRLISGRCSPDYSYGITDPHKDIQGTGTAVLGIWNERVSIAKDKFEPLRSSVLIRNPNALDFTIFEKELNRYNTSDFEWKSNKNGNLEGWSVDKKTHVFTWQPHGSQFTIINDVPSSAKRFSVKRPGVLSFSETIKNIGFDNSWVTMK